MSERNIVTRGSGMLIFGATDFHIAISSSSSVSWFQLIIHHNCW